MLFKDYHQNKISFVIQNRPLNLWIASSPRGSFLRHPVYTPTLLTEIHKRTVRNCSNFLSSLQQAQFKQIGSSRWRWSRFWVISSNVVFIFDTRNCQNQHTMSYITPLTTVQNMRLKLKIGKHQTFFLSVSKCRYYNYFDRSQCFLNVGLAMFVSGCLLHQGVQRKSSSRWIS